MTSSIEALSNTNYDQTKSKELLVTLDMRNDSNDRSCRLNYRSVHLHTFNSSDVAGAVIVFQHLVRLFQMRIEYGSTCLNSSFHMRNASEIGTLTMSL